MLSMILLSLFGIFVVGALPKWPYSRNWGYLPSSGLGVIVVIVLVLLMAKPG